MRIDLLSVSFSNVGLLTENVSSGVTRTFESYLLRPPNRRKIILRSSSELKAVISEILLNVIKEKQY